MVSRLSGSRVIPASAAGGARKPEVEREMMTDQHRVGGVLGEVGQHHAALGASAT